MQKITVSCSYCGEDVEKEVRFVVRAEESGLNLYCDKVCSNMNRRKQTRLEEIEKIYNMQLEKRAKKHYGEYWQCYIGLHHIKKLIKNPNYEKR